jgi:hypothetical protein
MGQQTLTVVARVQQTSELLNALASLSPGVFAATGLGIHFARVVFIPEAPPLSAWLVLESNFDTKVEDAETARQTHLSLLASEQARPLSTIFEWCSDFHESGGVAALEAFLVQRILPATASYQGHGARDLERIRLEARLHEVILTYLETAPAVPPFELFTRVREHVRSAKDPLLAGLNLEEPAPARPDAAVRTEKLAEFRSRNPLVRYTPWALNAHPALPIVPRLGSVLAWQKKDATWDLRARQEAWTAGDKQYFLDIARSEDHGGQNALTHVVALREGAGRIDVLRAAHAYIDRMSQRFFYDIGQLGGIPSIHFAKWLLIDDGARLLFLSNYDGSWESYLGDFVDQAAPGLNFAWSCTSEYPKTDLLAFDGAADKDTFKAWGRAHQVPTQVFYSAYPDLSIAAINNNTWIRNRLHDPSDAGDLDGWFRRLT